jgi:PAS domain S-box-containing protein
MVQFNTRANEILLKLVYYGPGLSGKTTNLQSLHAMCSEAQRGEMFSVNTQEDRTLFFDLLPINLGYIYGNAIHLQIYTVPGQVQYDASRRVVLGGADGVVFVADSSEAKMQENVDSLSNLYHNLNANRLNIKQIPFVLQYNKRDLPEAMAVGVMNRRLNFRSVPYFEAVANRGTGVLDTFLSIARETVGYTFKKYHLDKKIKDFDEMLNLIDSNVRASMHELPAAPEAPLAPAVEDVTTLRHTNVSVDDLVAGKAADAQDLLEDALKSNMETARLYSDLKQTKDALEKKNEELGQIYSQLDRANQDNLKTRKYLEGLIQNIGEAVVSFSLDGRILTWNQAAERIFGYSRSEIVGRSMAELAPDDQGAELAQVYQRVGQGQLIRDRVATRLRKGGEGFPANVTYAPVRGGDDRVLAYSALIRDLSEPSQGQEAPPGQKLAALGRLVPTLFHDVSNRLTPVLLDSHLIAESAMDAHQAEQVGRLVKAVESIQDLLQPLLTVLNPPRTRPVPVQLNHVVQAAASRVAALALELGATVDLNLDPSMPEGALDPDLLAQALLALLTNGLRSLGQGPTKSLRVATRCSGASLQVVVQDSGPPLTEARRAGLFNPECAGSTEALGLPLASIIVKQHGGRLSARSQEGLGNVLLVELPLVEAVAMAPAVPAELKNAKVLVVDDESFLLECLVDALESWGMTVVSSARAEEAIERLESDAFDLIVSDIRMPGLTGMDLYDWLKAQRPAMVQRILYTTGDSFDQVTREFLESTQVAYLGKPFELKQLRQGLERLLETAVEV